MTVTVIGVGLIGGSLALTLREKATVPHIIGVDQNPGHNQQAVELGIVDETMGLEAAIKTADVILLCVPVNAAIGLINQILDHVNRQVVIDVGSTKTGICDEANTHPNRGRFVAAHPMWGTEFSGPAAATRYAFEGNAVVICDREKSDPDALDTAQRLFTHLGMKIMYMAAENHDVHAAYVSHISHITSFALANTVLEKEKEESAIFGMASGGFESTVRLAKSNPEMWVPIFQQNRENVLDVLNEHITQLRKFKSCLEKENFDWLTELIRNSNKIKKILH